MNTERLGTNIEQLKPSALELFDLNIKQKIDLSARVLESKGLIRIFIHPISEWTSEKPVENQNRVTKILKSTVYSEKSPPIFILENGDLLQYWKKIFKENTPPKDIYLVPTMWNFSYPLVPGIPEPTEEDENGHLKKTPETDKYIIDGFNNLVNLLNQAGVKQILIGGTKLEIKDGELYRCVGVFLKILKDITNSKIKLSLGTAPLNRNDLRESYPDFV